MQIRRLATHGDGTKKAMATELLVMGPPGRALDLLAADGWDVSTPGKLLWTDDRSDLLSDMRW